jgi:hypothetical protein
MYLIIYTLILKYAKFSQSVALSLTKWIRSCNKLIFSALCTPFRKFMNFAILYFAKKYKVI